MRTIPQCAECGGLGLPLDQDGTCSECYRPPTFHCFVCGNPEGGGYPCPKCDDNMVKD